MTNLFKKPVFSQFEYAANKYRAALALLVVSALFSGSVFSDPLPALATEPLSATAEVVKPNLMFVFDTSQSMESPFANDTLVTYTHPCNTANPPVCNLVITNNDMQCKSATKNKTGTLITKLTVGPTPAVLSRPNTRLAIEPSSGFNNGDTVYLAIPGKPQYSGVYKIKAKNGTSTGCIGGTSIFTTTVTVNNPYKNNESNPAAVNPDKFGVTSYNPGNPLVDPPVAPTNGCAVPAALPANSGNTTADLNLGGGFVVNASGTTATPSSSCYIRDRKDTNGCKVTTAAPANSGSTTTNFNRGGGFLETAIGGVTTTPSTSCYWYDPLDTPIGTFVSCTNGTTGENSLEVDIATGAPAGALTAAEIVDARILLRQDVTTCLNNEPPLMAAKVQSLFYDPTVEYAPPPKPSGVGTPTATKLPSMTNPLSVRIDGTRLNASGDPITVANRGVVCNAAGTNLTLCNNTYSAPDNLSYDFRQWEEMVYCDTPNRPTGFASDRLWHESARCKRNTPASTSGVVNSSPRYPYPFPGKTDGTASPLTPSVTDYYAVNVEYQNLQPKTGKNPVVDLYAFGQTYKYAAPFYYNVEPIEYCDSAKLNNCQLVPPTGTNATVGPLAPVFKVPAYVRYCKTAAKAITTSGTSPAAVDCQGTYTGATAADYRFARYGLFKRIDVISGNSYKKTAGRTDCTGSIGDTGCSYTEELTNVANWYAYYRTRMQLMKSAIGRTFNELDKPLTPLHDESKDYRVGLITVEGYTTAGNYLPINDFLGGGAATQREKFYTSVYSKWPAGGTSLRDVLGAVGRIYAGEAIPLGLPAGDPIQHSCQQNYTLLTTDGYWNGLAGKKIGGGSNIGNQDADPTPFPQREGNVTYAPPASHTDTLADVAAYYYNTDLRNQIKFNNCTGVPVPPNVTGNEVCDDNADVDKATQRMTTFTLGLGVDGLLSSTGYKAGTSVDFEALKLGTTLRWPSPGPDDGNTTFTQAERATVDDLWHAAINGAEADRSQYFNARNPQDVIDGVRSALASLGDKKGTASTTSLSNVTPSGSDNLAFSTRYYTGTWTGNLFARTIDGQGVLSANAVWCVEDEGSPACQKGTPTAETLLDKAHAGNRKIWASNGTGLVKFEYNLLGSNQIHFQTANISGLSQWSGFDSTQKGLAKEDNLVKYLSGKNDYEQTNATASERLYRTREKILGDIIDSDPTFVGKAKYDFLDDNYKAFKLSTASRAETVYVGANDGMLHAFNAQTGDERWAFVPSAVMKNMWKLADNNYRNLHTNFVNGKITVADVCPTAPTTPCSAAQWRTILVSGLGQGGRGYFALDITESLKNAVNPPELLWEFDSSTESNLGYSYGRPIITKKMDGKWVVALTSGYNNTNDGKGRLFILDAMTGNQSLSGGISTNEGSSAYPSGLAQIAGFATSPNANNQTQYVYGGDLLGNLWRFDIDDRSSNLNANTVFKLTNISPRKITVPPTLSEIKGKRVINVGSGKYLESVDLDPQNYEQERLYTFTDEYITTTQTEAQLLARMEPQTLSAASGGERTGSGNSPDWTDSPTGWGWYADLPGSLANGERQNVKASLISGILFVATIIPPTGTCDISGKAWTNVFNFATGGLISSKQSASPIAGFYFVFSDPTDDKVAVGTDYTDGRSQNASNDGAVPCTSNCADPIPPRFDLLGTSGAFVGNRAIWRELVE